MTQHNVFKAKLGAIKEYNALKNRIKRELDVKFTMADLLASLKDEGAS